MRSVPPSRGKPTTAASDNTTRDGPASATRVPRYYEVKQQLRLRIDGLPAGTALPAERVLSNEFGTSRSTVRQALSQRLGQEADFVRLVTEIRTGYKRRRNLAKRLDRAQL